MNSARICWRRRSSETSSRTAQTPRTGDRRARTTRIGPSGPRTRNSPDAEPRVARGDDELLEPGVDERLHRRPADDRPRRRPSRRWAAGFASSTRSESSRRRMPTPIRSARYDALRVCWSSSNSLAVRRSWRRRTRAARSSPASSRVGQLADRLELAAAGEDEPDGDREQDRLGPDERDDRPVHGPRIAQAGWPRYPSRRSPH